MCECERINCGYYYQDEDDDRPCCHCPDDGFPAPCECDEPADIDDDCGYDPYMGCFTDDC